MFWVEMSHSGRFRVACVCALTQWALALAIQIGNFFGYLLPPGRDWKAAASLVTLIPLIQTQNVLVAAIFGVMAYFAAWNRITAWIFFGIYCAESIKAG